MMLTAREVLTVIPTSFDVWEQGFLTNLVNGSQTLVKVSLPTSKILTCNVETNTSSVVDIAAFHLIGIRDFNDSGNFCGLHDDSKTGDRSVTRGFIFDGEFHELDEGISYHLTLNNHRNVVSESLRHRPVLYHQTHGLILLDDAIVARNSEEQAIWDKSGWHHASALSEHNKTGFPIVAGTMMENASSGFCYGYVLFPMAQ